MEYVKREAAFAGRGSERRVTRPLSSLSCGDTDGSGRGGFETRPYDSFVPYGGTSAKGKGRGYPYES